MFYEFTPTQDLHGYDKPWAPGTGPNIWDEEWVNGYRNTSTGLIVPNDDNITNKNLIPCDPETSYYRKTGMTAGGNAILFYDENEELLSYVFPDYNTEFITPAGTHFLSFTIGVPTYQHDVSINYPSSLTSYYPYANICLPEGFNIWDPTQDQMIQVYSGYVDANANKLYLHPVYEEYDGEELVGPWMSSMDKYTEEGTPTTGAFVVDFGGDVTEYDITDFMLQTLLDSLGVRRFITSGAMLLNSLMDQAQGRVRSEEELLNRSLPLHVIAIGEDLPTNLVIKKPISDVLPGLPGKTKI